MLRRACFGVIAVLAVAGYCSTAQAQEAACGLRSVRETAAPVYPPIAKAAHVSGVVVVLAQFDLAGNVTAANVVSGPEMLRASALTFVSGWKANEYGGSRTCAVAVEFALTNPYACGDVPTPGVPAPVQGRVDALHYRVVGGCVVIQANSDPSPTKVWRHRWLGIRF